MKKSLKAGIAAAVLGSLCLAQSTHAATLVGYWSGNGTAVDSVFGNNGVPAPGQTIGYSTGLITGTQAFSLNGGNGTANSYVSIPDSSNYAFGTGDFSVSFWAKFSTLSTNQGMVAKDSYTGSSTYNGWLFNIVGDNIVNYLNFEVRNAVSWAGPDVSARYDTANLSNNQWYAIAGVREGDLLKFYVGGTLVDTKTGVDNIDLTNSLEMTIGALSSGSRQYLRNGGVEKVGLYSGALTAQEVAALAVVPEPSTWALLAVSATFVTILRRRRLS